MLYNGGESVLGRPVVEEGERRWEFHPGMRWRQGKYLLRVETILEDLAGNSVGRPFEVDLNVSEHGRPDTFVYRGFEIK